jgi:hypothetical protein
MSTLMYEPVRANVALDVAKQPIVSVSSALPVQGANGIVPIAPDDCATSYSHCFIVHPASCIVLCQTCGHPSCEPLTVVPRTLNLQPRALSASANCAATTIHSHNHTCGLWHACDNATIAAKVCDTHSSMPQLPRANRRRTRRAVPRPHVCQLLHWHSVAVPSPPFARPLATVSPLQGQVISRDSHCAEKVTFCRCQTARFQTL